jgi:hypothetical protein
MEKKPNWALRGFIPGVVCGILFVILLPHFLQRYEHKRRLSHEAKMHLGAMFTTQVAYFGECNTYAGGENCFEDMAWAPEGDNIYSYYCGHDVIRNTKGYVCPVPDVEHGISDTGFTVMAVGNIDNDPDCDVWTMNDAKVLRNVVVDP